ncbi:MAG TPA: HAMP domain-containing sensor histidine kinase [Aggregatilineales bacterium]|nr:HAMP domain-containing sensor histidine kinase [Aggregatilineales bacterium]
MTITFTDILAGGLSLGYFFLLLIGLRVRSQFGAQRWLLAFVVVALAAQVVALLTLAGTLDQPALPVYLTSLMLVLYVGLSIRYLQRSGATFWLLLGIVWLAAILVVSLVVAPTGLLGTGGWLAKTFQSPLDLSGVLAVAGWSVIGLLTLALTFSSLIQAHLPEIANRALFWMFTVPLLIVGAVLSVSGTPALEEVGWGIQFLTITGIVYSVQTHRVMDIRQVLRQVVAWTLLTAVAAIVVLVALIAGHNVDAAAESGILTLVGLAVLAAVVYAPLRSVMVGIVNRFFGGGSSDAAGLLRRYSENIAGVVELDELIDTAMTALRNTLNVRRGGLILATRDDNDTIRVEPMSHGMGDMPEVRGWIPKGSPVYKSLFDERMNLLQFDLEYDRRFNDIAPELLSFFKQLRMSAYAPIIAQGQLIGVLAAGSKNNDLPFYPQDLELLAAIANQTGVALRNARLVRDLRKATEEMQSLNKDLVGTKTRVEQLDAVKTDFITIASHELRTPLAQIRGYTDILDALNEQSMLDPDQMTGMTTNLRKATDRLERLIGDMLDVSQLGLDAMDLRFAQTTTENVLRLAIEPLTESVKQRKLTLVARGLRGLPPIEADMQRLVQAFRNIVTNAIKYTPDGGKIELSAHVQQNAGSGLDEIVVAIKDTGIGIDPKNQDLIFEKFFRISDPGLHSTGATKFMGAGPGLGLTIARGVIEGHGGRIWVESPGYDPEGLPGSTFYIVLPLVPPSTAKRVLAFDAAGVPLPAASPAPALASGKTQPEPTPVPVAAPATPEPAPASTSEASGASDDGTVEPLI